MLTWRCRYGLDDEQTGTIARTIANSVCVAMDAGCEQTSSAEGVVFPMKMEGGLVYHRKPKQATTRTLR